MNRPISRRELLSYAATAAGVAAIPTIVYAMPQNARIVPKRGRSGRPFVSLDPFRRLSRNALVLFTDPATGDVESTTLRKVNRDGRIGRGRIPVLAAGVVYDVTVQPLGQEAFPAGTFLVHGRRAEKPAINPGSGAPGSTFTISYPAQHRPRKPWHRLPLGRMDAGDVVIFYVVDEDEDPALGVEAPNVQVSPDGKTLTGEVPLVTGDLVYGVTVRPSPTESPRFDDLEFFVEAQPVLNPTIDPEMGAVGSDVELTDPQGRIRQGDICYFQEPDDPDVAPVEAPGVTISADGKTLLCKVPDVTVQRTYEITVRTSLQDAPRFEALSFFVEGVVSEPTIVPTEGGVGVTFTIDDNSGRIQSGDLVIFYLPGTQPSNGWPATDATVVSDGTGIMAHVPNVTTTLIYLVTVRADATSPPRFGDLTFSVL